MLSFLAVLTIIATIGYVVITTFDEMRKTDDYYRSEMNRLIDERAEIEARNNKNPPLEYGNGRLNNGEMG